MEVLMSKENKVPKTPKTPKTPKVEPKVEPNKEIKINETSIIALILSVFLPPLGVLIKDGLGASFIINCLLTLLGFIPGVIHAWFVILRK